VLSLKLYVKGTILPLLLLPTVTFFGGDLPGYDHFGDGGGGGDDDAWYVPTLHSIPWFL